ncbi:maltose operon protein MalM [Erwiniaceae bacterium CAU 1747]
MKKNLLSLCLIAGLSSASLLPATAATFTSPQNVAVAPAIPASALQRLSWLPITPPASQDMTLDAASQNLNQGDITGPVAAVTLPADRGSLEITLTSAVKDRHVYVPNVLVLDEQMRPAAFYPGSYFPYQKPGVVSQDRLEGTLKLTPALGQKQIYLLVYTTRQDLTTTTQLKNPAKAYAEGVGNAVPSIPDPIASHVSSGQITLKVKAEQGSGNIMIGQVFNQPQPQPVVVGSTAAPAAAAPAPAAPAAKAEPMLSDTESYFNQGIRQAVKAGDIDKALRLMNEAERLGSSSARQTFISSVKGKG